MSENNANGRYISPALNCIKMLFSVDLMSHWMLNRSMVSNKGLSPLSQLQYLYFV